MPLGPITVEADMSLGEAAEQKEPPTAKVQDGTRRVLSLPTSLTPRVLDGHWKKLMVFLGSDFLPAGNYQFSGTELIVTPQAAMHFSLNCVTILDPLDGARWTYHQDEWQRA